MTKKQKKTIKKFYNPFKEMIKQIEKEIQKDIDNTKEPDLKLWKEMMRDLADIESKLGVFELKYGIRFEWKKVKIPKNPKWWGKGVIKELFKQQWLKENL